MHFSPRPNRAAEIGWRAWGPDAFAAAKSEGKPVLLGISAVWCHWCHVMDETSYSDPDVIETINQQFIPVRVDTDQRPDVNARYNMGGWPSTIFLTPDGEILHGATYVPPEFMRSLLRRIADFWRDPASRLAVTKQVGDLQARREMRRRLPPGGALDPDTASDVFAGLEREYDEEFGGFGDEPKFPNTGALGFLLDEFARTKDGRAQRMVQTSLHAMADGGMYDRIEGGFFRYSTTRDFSVPHFEKMLEDLAGLLLACARAAAMFGDDGLRRTCIDVVRYADANLWTPELGGYGGSQDADEEYYGRDAVRRSETSKPFVDRTLYTSWNAQMARALLVAGPLLGPDGAGWARRGLDVLENVWSRLLVDGLMARAFDGVPKTRGLLADQAWAAWAALAAYSVSSDNRWLGRARDLLDASNALFDEHEGAYVDRLPDLTEPGRLRDRVVPIEENAVMARALVTLASFTGEAAYGERARLVLSRFSASYRSVTTLAAAYACAMLDVTEPPVDIHVVGSVESAPARALRDAALAIALPPIRVDALDPSRDAGRLRAMGYESSGDAVAYLCRGSTCFARVRTAAELPSTLEAGTASIR